jgi:hypothetical protein
MRLACDARREALVALDLIDHLGQRIDEAERQRIRTLIACVTELYRLVVCATDAMKMVNDGE